MEIQLKEIIIGHKVDQESDFRKNTYIYDSPKGPFYIQVYEGDQYREEVSQEIRENDYYKIALDFYNNHENSDYCRNRPES